MTSLRPLAIAAGPDAVAALPLLRRALDGEFAVLPYAASSPPPPSPDGAAPDEGTAVVVGTSGSTGSPKLAMLPARSLAASATATHGRLGGPGAWLLAMPPHHIAGVQVLLRCVAAGTEPGFVDLSDGFTPDAFSSAATRFAETTAGARRYTALVPTQLVRLLADEAATAALAGLDAVLVGGAASPPALLARARAVGVRAVTTYGMSETCGGCVYDGEPLTGTTVRADPDGRLLLGGPTLATGYLGRPDLTAAAFMTDVDGTRWFRTDDVGHRDEQGWHVDGRLDDLITTGGLKVAPRLVEEALTALPGIAEAVVVGTHDDDWGQVVSAAIVPSPEGQRPGSAAPTVTTLREQLRGILPAHALPRRVLVLTAIPLRGPGKPDRVAVADRFAADA
ncbi:o-succinylbenzoate--CoA ligase [Pedococcus sp. P5_B7]